MNEDQPTPADSRPEDPSSTANEPPSMRSEDQADSAATRSSAERGLMALALLLGLALAGALAWRGADWVTERALVSATELAGGDWAGGLRSWWLERNADLLEPVGADDRPVDFEVLAGELLPELSSRLEAEGLIRDAAAFRTLARVRGLDTRIQAGAHVLRRDMSAEEVLEELLLAPADQVILTIPEGRRLEEVAELVAAIGLAQREAFIALATEPDRSRQAWLSELPEGATLEGYLFPDTYAFEPEAGAEAVIDRLLTTFEDRASADLRAAAEAQSLSLHDWVTLASIVEREAVLDEERGRIARVFLNRLAEPPYILNADPTIQYALGFQPEAQTWWKRPLLLTDLELDSPYNSYRVPGLPPSPIASPGFGSLRAVAQAEPGPWQYFVANDIACDGSHVFAETLEQHNANVATYRTGDCGR